MPARTNNHTDEKVHSYNSSHDLIARDLISGSQLPPIRTKEVVLSYLIVCSHGKLGRFHIIPYLRHLRRMLQIRRHPQNRTYITYRNAARGEPTTERQTYATYAVNLVGSGHMVPEICVRTDMHTDRQTGTPITSNKCIAFRPN